MDNHEPHDLNDSPPTEIKSPDGDRDNAGEETPIKGKTKAGHRLRPYHHGSLRKALIEAAITLIDEKGAEGFTLRQAARRAGVSPAAPYRHFPDKTTLLAAVATESFQRLNRLISDAVAAAGDAPQDQLRAQSVAFVRFAVENPAHLRTMYAPNVLDPKRFPELSELSQRTNSLAWRAVRRGQQTGVMRTEAPAATALASVALSYGLARLMVDGMLPDAGDDPDVATQLANALQDVLSDGVAV